VEVLVKAFIFTWLFPGLGVAGTCFPDLFGSQA
jgi:hypothetical protein